MKLWATTFLYLVAFTQAFSQMVVTDPTANLQRKAQQALSLKQEKIQAISQILINTMQGDMRSTLEIMAKEHDILIKNEEIGKTLENVLAVTKSFERFETSLLSTKRSMEEVQGKMKRVTSSGSFNIRTLRDINRTLDATKRAYDRAMDTWKKAIDLKETIAPKDRLEMILGAEEQLEDVQEELENVDEVMDAAIWQEERKATYIEDYLPPTTEEADSSGRNTSALLSAFSAKVKERSDASLRARTERASRLARIVFGYGDKVIALIWLLVVMAAFRGGNSPWQSVMVLFWVTTSYMVLQFLILAVI